MITTDACIEEAVSELIGLLDGKNYSKDGAIAEVAGDFDVNPALLVRKFKERTGLSVEDYTAIPEVDFAARNLASAKEVAAKFASRYNINPENANRLGKQFTLNGELHVYILIDGAEPVWGLKAVKVASGEVIKFHRSVWKKILEQVNA